MAKSICCIYLDAELKKKAHDLGLNLSRVMENTLRALIAKLEDTEYAKSIEYKNLLKKQELEEIF